MSTDTKKVRECHYMAIMRQIQWQMAPAPSLSWLNNFPGDISARGVIPVWWACDSSSFCSHHPGGRSKAQLTASIYKSSLVCLLWTPATPRSLSSTHPWLSCKLLCLTLSLSSLQGTLYLYHPGSLAVYIIAIYNQLIHLWPLHSTLIKLL